VEEEIVREGERRCFGSPTLPLFPSLDFTSAAAADRALGYPFLAAL
jgi:hypothetical protein